MLVSIQIKHLLNKTSMLMLGRLNDSLKIYIELEEELGIIVMVLNDELNFNYFCMLSPLSTRLVWLRFDDTLKLIWSWCSRVWIIVCSFLWMIYMFVCSRTNNIALQFLLKFVWSMVKGDCFELMNKSWKLEPHFHTFVDWLTE